MADECQGWGAGGVLLGVLSPLQEVRNSSCSHALVTKLMGTVEVGG